MIRLHTCPALRIAVSLLPLLMLAACSGEDSPTPPPPPPEYPPIPTVNSPTAELPNESERVTNATALLSNFSPKVSGGGPFIQDLNDNSLCGEFRVAPGHCMILKDGEVCDPTTLQWRPVRGTSIGDWEPLYPGSRPPCFRHLLSREGSHYYLSSEPATWMIADVNCRLVGGDLASFSSQAEHDAVYNALANLNPFHSAFIGFTDWGQPNNSFIWRNGEPVVWTNWDSGEPNDSGPEFFAYIKSNSKWNDARQWSQIYYLMETQEEFHGDDGDEDVPVLLSGSDSLHLRGCGHITELPCIERRLYWKKVFQRTLEPGWEYSQEHSYTIGTNYTFGFSFGFSIGYTGGADWGLVSTKIEYEFHMDFDFEWSCSTEETWADTYTCTAPDDKTVIFAVWQLRERFVICDENGEPWSDPNYVLAEDLPYLDQGLRIEYLQTIEFDQQ